jgi:hypothetical protein
MCNLLNWPREEVVFAFCSIGGKNAPGNQQLPNLLLDLFTKKPLYANIHMSHNLQ